MFHQPPLANSSCTADAQMEHTCSESPLNIIESHYSGTVLWWFLNVTELGLCLAISLQVQTLRSWLDNLNLGSCACKKAVFLCEVLTCLSAATFEIHWLCWKVAVVAPSIRTLNYSDLAHGHITSRQIAKAVVIGFLLKAHKAAWPWPKEDLEGHGWVWYQV